MVNLVIAILAHRKGLSSTGNHEFFPTLFAFQILEFADVYHLQVISCTTIFTLAGSKSIHKTCVLHSSVAGEIVSIIYACFLSPAKTSMIDFTYMRLAISVNPLHTEELYLEENVLYMLSFMI